MRGAGAASRGSAIRTAISRAATCPMQKNRFRLSVAPLCSAAHASRVPDIARCDEKEGMPPEPRSKAPSASEPWIRTGTEQSDPEILIDSPAFF